MAKDFKEYLLSTRKGCSGRGVRVRVLDATTRFAIREESGKGLSPEATMIEWKVKEGIDGVVACVAQITESAGFKTLDEMGAPTVAWKSVTAEYLHDHLTDYFSAKDLDALVGIFRKLHDLDPKELEDIMGEGRDVTVD